MDDLEPMVSQIAELLHNKKSTEKILQQWGERNIPYHVFQTTLDNHNTDFVREHIVQSSRLIQSSVPYISKFCLKTPRPQKLNRSIHQHCKRVQSRIHVAPTPNATNAVEHAYSTHAPKRKI